MGKDEEVGCWRGPDVVVRLQVKAELGLDSSVRCLLRHRASRDVEGWLISIWVTASMYLVGGVDKTNGRQLDRRRQLVGGLAGSSEAAAAQSSQVAHGWASGQSGSRINSVGIGGEEYEEGGLQWWLIGWKLGCIKIPPHSMLRMR